MFLRSRSAQEKPKANARKKPKPQQTSSGSIPSMISDMDKDAAEDEPPNDDEAGQQETDQKSFLRVAKKPERPGDRGKGRKRAGSKVDKENATPELPRRAAVSPVAAKPGRFASGLGLKSVFCTILPKNLLKLVWQDGDASSLRKEGVSWN